MTSLRLAIRYLPPTSRHDQFVRDEDGQPHREEQPPARTVDERGNDLRREADHHAAPGEPNPKPEPNSLHAHEPTGEPAPRNRATRRAALVEDAEWMAQTGETMPGAAARLHLRPGSLRESLKRAGRPDLWARLIANADPSYPVTGTIGRAA